MGGKKKNNHDRIELDSRDVSKFGKCTNRPDSIIYSFIHCPFLMLVSHLEYIVHDGWIIKNSRNGSTVTLTWLLGWEVIAEDETKETDNNLSLSNLDSSPGTSGHKGHDSSGNFHLQKFKS